MYEFFSSFIDFSTKLTASDIINGFAAAGTIVALFALSASNKQNKEALDKSTEANKLTEKAFTQSVLSDSRTRAATAIEQLTNDSVFARLNAVAELRELYEQEQIDPIRLSMVLSAYLRDRADKTHTPHVLGNCSPQDDFSETAKLLSDIYIRDKIRADLAIIDLSNMYLSNVQLCGATLKLAKFTSASLNFVNLKETILNGVNFSSTNLEGSVLDGADLTDAINLTWTQLKSAASYDGAILPSYLQPQNDAPFSD